VRLIGRHDNLGTNVREADTTKFWVNKKRAKVDALSDNFRICPEIGLSPERIEPIGKARDQTQPIRYRMGVKT